MLRLILLLVSLALPAAAQDRAAVERQFQSWLADTIWPQARAQGVSRATYDSAMRGVTLDWSLSGLRPPGSPPPAKQKQTQAEFGSPARYFRRSVLDSNSAIGRRMAKRHASALAETERRFGVPGRVVLAIWGRESGFGGVKLPHNAFRVLATRGFMSDRKDFFTRELVFLLRVAQDGHAPISAMKSSWAGALGQPQYMPSNMYVFAADGDGDGRYDIWGSQADTIASIGMYLNKNGWQKGRDWGFEIDLPRGVSCTLEGKDNGRTIAQWERLGIRRVSGKAFPEHERTGEAFLLLPAGRNGPAFLVTPNFYALKSYNFSDLYALFVGHVGDRIQYGMGDFQRPWGKVGGLYRSDVAAMQRALERMGHDVGGADGLAGFKTRRSIGKWQESRGQLATCFPEAAMKSALR